MEGIEKSEALASPWRLLWRSTIGKKQIVAVTGLSLCGFLVVHLLGNFLLLVGPEAFNLYSHKLTSATPLIYVAEIILAAIFFIHLSTALTLVMHNKASRGQKYYLKKKTGEGANFFSATMPYTGLLILAFLISHLLHFKFGTHYSTTLPDHNDQEMRDMYRTVMEYFSDPLRTTWYVVVMIVMWMHLFHGVKSSFQSLGINHQRWNCFLKFVGRTFGVLVPMGFLFISVWCYFQAQQ